MICSRKPSTCCACGPILLQRHRGQAERALANVDLYLSLTRAYRGTRPSRVRRGHDGGLER